MKSIQIEITTRASGFLCCLCCATLLFMGVPMGASANTESTDSPSSANIVQVSSNESSASADSSSAGVSGDSAALLSETTSSSDALLAKEEPTTGIQPSNEPVLSPQDEAKSQELPEAEAAVSAPLLMSSSNGVGQLITELSNEEGVYEDVDSFPGGLTDWALNDTRTLHLDFEFRSGQNKTIQILVPRDYQVVGRSAMEGAETYNELQNITIDQQYSGYFTSSSIVGEDGYTRWDDQGTSDYLGGYSHEEGWTMSYGGILTYTFSDDTTKGELVVTLAPYELSLAHLNYTEEADPISVSMSSSAGSSLTSSFRANVWGMETPSFDYGAYSIWGSEEANVLVDSDTGLSEQFGVLAGLWLYEPNRFGYEYSLLDSITYRITYPRGVSFDNQSFCEYLGYTDPVPGTGTIVADHFTVTVTGNKQRGGTVTLQLDKTNAYHSEGGEVLGAFFQADTSRGLCHGGDTLPFHVSYTLENQGVTTSREFDYERTLLENGSGYLLETWSLDTTRRDMKADFPDYDGITTLGGWQLWAKVGYEDLTFAFDFSDLRGVRSLDLPGYNISDVEATTTEGRTLTIEDVGGHANQYNGVPLTDVMLGLHDDEYLVTLTCHASVEQLLYGKFYLQAFSYGGYFADHQEGDAIFSVLDENGNIAINEQGNPITATDHTTIGWNNSSGFWMETSVNDYGDGPTTFYPNETIHFTSYVCGGIEWADWTTLIDPIIMISLPKGVNLDTSSVMGYCCPDGNEVVSRQLVQKEVPRTQDIGGVEWTTYYFSSAHPMDMIAPEENQNHDADVIEVKFDARIASNVPEYGQISLTDVVQFDLLRTIPNWQTYFTDSDTYNRAGNGTDYILNEAGGNITIKPLIGLNVDLGIRIAESGTDFFTYNGMEDSVAAITSANGETAEVMLSYNNTAASDYFTNSTIYLPIPKVGHDYTHFFQNIELVDPLNINTPTTFEFSTALLDQVNLSGFTTYYAVEVAETEEAYDPSTNAGTWAPLTSPHWYSYAQLGAAGYDLSDVVMLKLVASQAIDSGVAETATFRLAVEDGAALGQMDYWRAYSKAVTKAEDSSGIWNYSSVLAATPVNFGVTGQVFLDLDHDGFFNQSGAIDQAYAGGHVSALLSRDGGGMDSLALAVGADGSFRSLNPNGTTYYLKPGDYTITFENTDEVYFFSGKAGAQASTAAAWYNDLRPSDINEQTATYHFSVEEGSLEGTYVGIALSDFVEIISIDVPVKVKLAVNTDGSWCVPTARDNRIINHSNVAITTTDITSTATSGFTLLDDSDDQTTPNGFSGTVCANDGLPVLLGQAQTPPASQWTMSADNGSTSDRSDELALQLNGHIQNVSGHYFTAPIHLFDSTYTFEKAL